MEPLYSNEGIELSNYEAPSVGMQRVLQLPAQPLAQHVASRVAANCETRP